MANYTTPQSAIESEMLFATPIMKVTLDNADSLNARLKEKIYAHKKTDKGLQLSNIGGWHSTDDMMNWAEEEAQVLISTAMHTCPIHTVDIHPMGKRDFHFDMNMWANINQKGHANNSHTHPGCLWSCVYYVDDGIEGDPKQAGGTLMLEDPRFPMNVMYVPGLVLKNKDGSAQYTQHSITPKTGMMVIFPSWLRHHVTTYYGNRDRISIALNLMVKET